MPVSEETGFEVSIAIFGKVTRRVVGNKNMIKGISMIKVMLSRFAEPTEPTEPTEQCVARDTICVRTISDHPHAPRLRTPFVRHWPGCSGVYSPTGEARKPMLGKSWQLLSRIVRPQFLAHCLLAGISLTIPSVAIAQSGDGALSRANDAPDDLTVSVSIRPRIEAISGQFRPNAAREDALLSVRTTLAVDYHPNDFFIGGEIWDVRGYLTSDRSSTGTGEINALEPIQAYIGYQLGDALGDGSSSRITAGRFTQDLGARRFMARQRFRNTTNSFTGVKLDYSNARGDSALAFWTMPQRRLPQKPDRIVDNAVVLDHEGTDLQFFGGSYTRAAMFGGTVQIYGFGLSERDTLRFATNNRRLFTPGARISRSPAARIFDYDVEATYQTGKARRTNAVTDVTDLDVSAYFLHAGLGYTFPGTWRPRVVVQYDLASGNNPESNVLGRFDTLFGARREYGPTDLYGLFQRSNMSSPSIRFEAEPDDRTAGFIEYRAGFLPQSADSFAASGVRDPDGGSGSFAGHQFELGLNRVLVPDRVKLSAGAVYLIKGRFLNQAPNAPPTGDTVYGFADLSFSF